MNKVNNAPKVSVVTVTYNQEKYIRQTIESIVSQKTNFNFELIVGDDASTDATPSIIAELAQKYPSIIVPVLRKKNLGIAQNFATTMAAARGEYIALCEGDDYWTDNNKLQIQADFMDKHSSYAICFHPVQVFFEGGEQPSYDYPVNTSQSRYNLDELLKNNFVQTNSVIYRKQDYSSLPTNILPVDWYLHVYHATFGKIGYIDKVMASYRRHPGGVWWNSYADIDKIWEKYGDVHLNLYLEFLKLFSGDEKREQIITKHVRTLIGSLLAADKKVRNYIMADVPQYAKTLLFEQYDDLQDVEAELQKITTQNEMSAQLVRQKETHIKHLEGELRDIKSSRLWKVRTKFAQSGKKIK